MNDPVLVRMVVRPVRWLLAVAVASNALMYLLTWAARHEPIGLLFGAIAIGYSLTIRSAFRGCRAS